MFDVREEAVRLTEELIRFNTYEEDGKKEILQYVYDYMGDDVVEKQIVEKETSPYLLAHIKGAQTEKPFILVLQGHLDVVPAGNMVDAFIPKIKDGKMRARGACDMKSGCASILASFKAAAMTPELQGDIYLAFTTDEEFSSQRIKEIISDYFPHADLALVGEPTESNLGVGSKGNLWLDIVIKGVSGHGSVPEVARNTINFGNQFLNELFNYVKEEFPKKKDEVFGYPTYSVGSFQAGEYPNIIPDLCKIQIDRRYLPGETDEEIVEEINNLLDICHKKMPGYTTEMKKWDFGWHSFCFPMEGELYGEICEALKNVKDFTPVAKGVPYWGEGGYINDKIPTIYFGPGSISDAHSSHEFVLVEDIKTVAAGYWEIVKRFCF